MSYRNHAALRPAGTSPELTQDTVAWYAGTRARVEARATPVPGRAESLRVAMTGSARFTVAGRFGTDQHQGHQRAKDGQRRAGVERPPESFDEGGVR